MSQHACKLEQEHNKRAAVSHQPQMPSSLPPLLPSVRFLIVHIHCYSQSSARAKVVDALVVLSSAWVMPALTPLQAKVHASTLASSPRTDG